MSPSLVYHTILQDKQWLRDLIEDLRRYSTDRLGKQTPPKHRLHNALLTLNFLNANEKGQIAAERHWTMEKTAELNQPV